MAASDLVQPGLAVVIMGVSGCGKSTVAAMLAEALGCSFVEADDYHSQANKAKMSKGVPLTDEDLASTAPTPLLKAPLPSSGRTWRQQHC